MRTEVLVVDPERPAPEPVARAAAHLKAGRTVAFPTETVYGLGADALNPAAVRAVFRAKGRPADNPVIVHVGDPADLERVAAAVPPAARLLAARFWPGPLSIIVPRAAAVPREVTAGLDTVAVRMPAHPVALALIRAAGRPVAAPSANRSGRPSPTTAAHVLADLDGRIAAVLDGGPAPVGLESTVVDVTGDALRVLRPGGVPVEALEAVVGAVRVERGGPLPAEAGAGYPLRRAADAAPARSPGTKYRHYAPATPLILFEGPPAAVAEAILAEASAAAARGERVAVLCSAESAGLFRGRPGVGEVLAVGPRQAPKIWAAGLFAALRRLDAAGAAAVCAEAIPEAGLGLAVMDRLRRAARRVVRPPNGGNR